VGPAQADDLFIRNRPFKGAVSGSGAQMMVELAPLAEALGVQARAVGSGWLVTRDANDQTGQELASQGQVVVEGTSVTSNPGADGAVMVNLAEVARVLGAKVTPNKELGTVDVYLVDRVATPSGGDWSSDPAGGKSPSQVVMAMMATMKNLPSAESLLAMKNEADLKAGMGVMEDLAKQQLPYMSKAMQAQMKEKMKASRAQMASQKPPAQAAEEGADNPFVKMMLATMFTFLEDLRTGTPTVVDEQIGSDSAKVVVEMPMTDIQTGQKSPKRATIDLVKESGAWKVNSGVSFKAD
ncbi:MAG: hypothetical protein KC910_07135, partial [Candidatus Eremiobacteraeota bacterium]|nr:hypothetical protein [Candidatus Eremiobacteraeota bacterium]